MKQKERFRENFQNPLALAMGCFNLSAVVLVVASVVGIALALLGYE